MSFFAILVALAIIALSIWLKGRATAPSTSSTPAYVPEPSPFAHLADTFAEDDAEKEKREKEKAASKPKSAPKEEKEGECCGGGTCGSKKQAQEASDSCCSSKEDSCCKVSIKSFNITIYILQRLHFLHIIVHSFDASRTNYLPQNLCSFSMALNQEQLKTLQTNSLLLAKPKTFQMSL